MDCDSKPLDCTVLSCLLGRDDALLSICLNSRVLHLSVSLGLLSPHPPSLVPVDEATFSPAAHLVTAVVTVSSHNLVMTNLVAD